MGLGDFFKNIFGKKTCSFCGNECGMMHRTKIKGDDYICSTCDDGCSFYIRKSRLTKAEMDEHLAYMKRCDRIYKEVLTQDETRTLRLPSATNNQGFEFFDNFGMFRIMDSARDGKDRYPFEVFRYDQVACYEPYIEESEPSEPGKPKEFKEGGVKITLVGTKDDLSTLRKGAYAHPYIMEPIKVCFAKSKWDQENYMKYVENVIHHFDYIFGVHDNDHALFSIGMNKKEKRDLMAGVAFAKTAMSAIKVAKEGEESLTDEKKAEIMQNMNAIDDAQTNGLAEYSRRADAAEAKINQ